VREEGVVEKKGKADEEKAPEIAPAAAKDFHQAEKGKRIERRIEEKAVALVKEIIEEGVDPGPQRNGQYSLLEGFGPLGCHDAFIDSHGRESAVQVVEEKVKEDGGGKGESQKGQALELGSVFLDEEVKGNAQQWPEDEIVLQPEPGKQAENKPREKNLARRHDPGGGDFSENIKGKKRYGDLGIKMAGVEKDRGAERIESPEAEGNLVSFPQLFGVKIELNPEQRGPGGEARLEDKGEPATGEELTQPVERKHQDGNSGEVDGINILSALAAVAAVDSQPQARVVFFRVEGKIVLLGVVIGQVEVSVFEEAVGGQKVKGLVAGEGSPLDDQKAGSGLISEKGDDKKQDEFSAAGIGLESCRRAIKPGGVLSLEAGITPQLGENDSSEDKKGKEAEPRSEVVPGHVEAKKPGRDKKKGQGKRGQKPCPELRSRRKVKPSAFPARREDPGQKKEGRGSSPEKNKDGVKPEGMVKDGKTAALEIKAEEEGESERKDEEAQDSQAALELVHCHEYEKTQAAMSRE
jgi:hypothetical protein